MYQPYQTYWNMADSIVREYVRETAPGTNRYVVDCHYGRFCGNSPQSVRTILADHLQETWNTAEPRVIDLR